jgi:putative transposase
MEFRRYYVPDAIVFITQVVAWRVPIFCDARWAALLFATLHCVQDKHPFTMLGYVLLPDHLHLLIRPHAPQTHSTVMQSLKRNFALEYKKATGLQGTLRFWQPRYYDHVIRDEVDFERHLHYIHYNPVKHGLAARPEDWPRSSFLHWKARGAYADYWGWSLPDTIDALHGDGME